MKRIIRKIRGTRIKKNDEEFYDDLKSLLRFKPKDLSIYKVAFIHSSLKKTDERGNPLNYERLEYLGDAILGAIIASFLYKEVPAANEGYLKDIELNKILDFEAALISYFNSAYAEMMGKINQSGDYNVEIIAQFKAGIEKFKSTQTW